jgi:hypothetical protein
LFAPTNTVFSGDKPTLVEINFRKLAISTNALRTLNVLLLAQAIPQARIFVCDSFA